MPNLVFVSFLLGLSFALACNAATYMVGDTSGWDVSTNIDSWAQDKTFAVGDILLFLHSSYHSLEEVTRDGFGSCNTSNVLRTFTTGNTAVLLTSPGSRYFVCGNKLHCLGGLKLQVHVQGNQANSPVATPQAQPGGRTQPNSPVATPQAQPGGRTQPNSPVATPQAQPGGRTQPNSPVAAHQAQPGGSTQPSFKNNNPVLNSAGFLDGGRDSRAMALITVSLLWIFPF